MTTLTQRLEDLRQEADAAEAEERRKLTSLQRRARKLGLSAKTQPGMPGFYALGHYAMMIMGLDELEQWLDGIEHELGAIRGRPDQARLEAAIRKAGERMP